MKLELQNQKLDETTLEKYLEVLWQARISLPPQAQISFDEVEIQDWIEEQLKRVEKPEDQTPVSYVACKLTEIILKSDRLDRKAQQYDSNSLLDVGTLFPQKDSVSYKEVFDNDDSYLHVMRLVREPRKENHQCKTFVVKKDPQ